MIPDYTPPSPAVLAWAAAALAPRARVSRVARLTGGITAAMDRITLATPAGPTDVVLRRWPDEPHTVGAVGREAAALAAVRGRAVPAPRLLALDEDGAQTGVRCTLTSALPGRPDLTPVDLPAWLEQLAVTQAAIHTVRVRTPRAGAGDGAAGEDRPPLDWYASRHRSLSWIEDRGLREAARQAAAAPPQAEETFVHGDYQHFNVLWQAGRLTGVVDWPNATTGNRGSNVGHCRLNLAVLFHADVAATYLRAYEQAAGVRVDRRADLRALLCYDPEWQRFIPLQVAGRAPLDLAGMPGRVTAAVRDALAALG